LGRRATKKNIYIYIYLCAIVGTITVIHRTRFIVYTSNYTH